MATVQELLAAWHNCFGQPTATPSPGISAQAQQAAPGIYDGSLTVGITNAQVAPRFSFNVEHQPLVSSTWNIATTPQYFLATDRTIERAKCGGGCPLGSPCDNCWPHAWERQPDGTLKAIPNPLSYGYVDPRAMVGSPPEDSAPPTGKLLAQTPVVVHRHPPPKCKPGCTPKTPCETEPVCPSWRESEVAACQAADEEWAKLRGKRRKGGVDFEAYELRAASMWTCGLVRTR